MQFLKIVRHFKNMVLIITKLLIYLPNIIFGQSEDIARTKYDFAFQAFKVGDWSAAADAFTSVLNLTEKKALRLNSLYFRGNALNKLDSCDQAITDLKDFIQLNPIGRNGKQVTIAEEIIEWCKNGKKQPNYSGTSVNYGSTNYTEYEQYQLSQSYYSAPSGRRLGFVIAVGPNELKGEDHITDGIGLNTGMIIPIGFLGLMAKFDYVPFEVESHSYMETMTLNIEYFTIAGGLHLDLGSVQRSIIVPFLQGGAGVTFASYSSYYEESGSESAFTTFFGGGLQLRLTKILSLPFGVCFKSMTFGDELEDYNIKITSFNGGLRILF